jgi:hypothetical protein
MHFSTPTIALLFAFLTTAQMSPEDSICTYFYGPDFTDACCPSITSSGPGSPCTDIVYVDNLTMCTSGAFPTGWSVCVERVSILK